MVGNVDVRSTDKDIASLQCCTGRAYSRALHGAQLSRTGKSSKSRFSFTQLLQHRDKRNFIYLLAANSYKLLCQQCVHCKQKRFLVCWLINCKARVLSLVSHSNSCFTVLAGHPRSCGFVRELAVCTVLRLFWVSL